VDRARQLVPVVFLLAACVAGLACKAKEHLTAEAASCRNDCLAGQPYECQSGENSPVNQCLKAAQASLQAKDLAGFNQKSRECDALAKTREGAVAKCTADFEACVSNCRK
jgi:hypothetical protein